MGHYDPEREAEMETESEKKYYKRKYNETNDPTYLEMLEALNSRK
jgi:hypothetical protein